MRKLMDVCELIVDCPHTTAPDEGAGYPLIRTPNIGKGRLILDNVHRVCKEVYDARNARAIPQADDIILAREAPAGNVALIQKGQEVCLGQRTVLIRADKEKVNPAYLTYYLLAPKQQHDLKSSANGATVGHINMPRIRGLKVDLPVLSIQRKIAEILSAYDNLIDNYRRQIKLLEEAAQRLYKEWFVDLHFPGSEHTKIVDGVPKGWKKSNVGSLCTLRKSLVSTDKIPTDCAYIGLEHMPRIDFCLSKWGKVDSIASSKYRYKEDDIIFGKIRPYFHKVGFAINEGVVSSDSFVMTANKGYWAILLMTVFDKAFVDYTYQTCKEGAKMPRADWKYMKAYKVLIPSESIRMQFEDYVWNISRLIKSIALQNNVLTEARDRLLPRLISGEIKV